jgi:hypothetical protein
MRLFLFITAINIISYQSAVQTEKPPKELLQNYSNQSYRTDPDDYVNIYSDLPHSLDSLNQIND